MLPLLNCSGTFRPSYILPFIFHNLSLAIKVGQNERRAKFFNKFILCIAIFLILWPFTEIKYLKKFTIEQKLMLYIFLNLPELKPQALECQGGRITRPSGKETGNY